MEQHKQLNIKPLVRLGKRVNIISRVNRKSEGRILHGFIS